MIDKKLSAKDNITLLILNIVKPIGFGPGKIQRASGWNTCCVYQSAAYAVRLLLTVLKRCRPCCQFLCGRLGCSLALVKSYSLGWYGRRARSNHTQDDCRIGVVANGFPVGTRHSLQGRLPFVAAAKMEFWHCFRQARGQHMLTYSSTANADWLLLALLGRVESNRRTRKQLIRGPQNNRSKRTW